MGMTPQSFHTFPTSCAILPTFCQHFATKFKSTMCGVYGKPRMPEQPEQPKIRRKLILSKVQRFMYDHPTRSISELRHKTFYKCTYKPWNTYTKFQSTSFNLFQVESLLVFLHNVFCQQSPQFLIAEWVWSVPSSMCIQHPVDMPRPRPGPSRLGKSFTDELLSGAESVDWGMRGRK